MLYFTVRDGSSWIHMHLSSAINLLEIIYTFFSRKQNPILVDVLTLNSSTLMDTFLTNKKYKLKNEN